MPSADEVALRAIRAADTALQERWPEGESPRSWDGVTWSDDRVQELYLTRSGLEVLAPQIGQLTALTKLVLWNCKQLKELPPQIGQLTALTDFNLDLSYCDQLTLAPGAEKEGQRAQTVVAAYARLLIVAPRKDTPGELHAFLRANPLAVPTFFKHIVGDLTGEAITAWLGEAIKATPELANLTAPDGRSVTDVAEQARLSRATAKPDEEALRAMRAASTALQEWWPEYESPLSWRGVSWSDDRVQELNFKDSGLEVLAPQIGQLTALTKLSLYKCKQLKELPPQIGQLTGLTALDLHDSGLEVLAPQIGQLTALTDLDLRYCEQLKELPPQIGLLTALIHLDLNGCKQLKELPPQIGQLTALIHLDLSYCTQLKELPPQIGQLTALTALGLRGCSQLKELPPQIGQLTALTDFNLDLYYCDQLTLAPGAEKEGQPAQAIVAAYAPLLIVAPRKDAPGELLAFLRDNKPAVAPFFKILTDAAHAIWLGEAVKATPELAKLTDSRGRRAVDVAHATCRQRMLESSWLCKRYELQPGPPEHRSATSVVIRADDHADKPDYAKIFDDADTDKSGTLEGIELDAVAKKLGLSKGLIVSEAAKQGSATSTDGLSKEAFVSACKRLLGDGPRKVVIKLMKDKVQWQREMTSRSCEWNAAANKYTPSQNKVTLDAQYVVQALDAPTQTEMAAAVSKSRILQDLASKYMEKASIKDYVYPVVMDAANRNLAQIYLQERPGTDALRDLARQIFEAVQHLHSQKLMHGDLKTLNLVRSVMDGKLRLIDFDAFASIIEGGNAGESYACAKFSSGVLPPEALHELKDEERSLFDTYWEVIKDDDPDLWAKVQPKSSEQGKQYVVKTFRMGNNGKHPIKEGLPYKLLPASASLDMWSLGVMLYVLFTGENLVPVTRDDDFVSGTGMGYVFDWDHNKLLEKLLKVEDSAAYSLLLQLLSPDAKERCKKSLQSLLEKHLFFNPSKGAEDTAELKEIKQIVLQNKKIALQNNERIREVRAEQDKQTELLLIIKELSVEHKTELRHTSKTLMKGIFEATEVHMPTTFIVLNNKLPALLSKEEKDELLQIAEDGSGVTLSAEFCTLTFTEEGASVEPAGKCKEYVEHLNTGVKWVNRLKDIGSSLAAGKVGDAFETIKEGLGDLVTGETMYLYLVDELTGKPVRADGYPIEITTPSEIVPKLLPVMQVGLRAMSIFNGAAGIARMVGYPVPKVPEALTTGVRESVDMLKKKSSVEEFDTVQEVVDQDGAKKESDSLRGHSLRDFTDFLNANDPGLKAGKSGHFAGLQRVPDPNSGTALWTTLTDPQEIKSALEARTHEREAELRAGNKYIQEQAAGGIAPTPSEAASDVETLRAELKAAREEEAKARAEAATARKDAATARREAEAAGGCTRPVAEPDLAEAAAEATREVATQVVATNDRQDQQITSQLSKIQDDLSELKRDGVKIDVKVHMCIIG